jgi:hypothetical protein
MIPQVRSGWYPPLIKRAARPGGEFFNLPSCRLRMAKVELKTAHKTSITFPSYEG